MKDKSTELLIKVSGKIVESNFDQYAAEVIKRIEQINENLQTDEDFTQAKEVVTNLKKAEDSMSASKAEALKQAEAVNELFAAIDDVSDKAREKRLSLEKIIKNRNEELRKELINKNLDDARNHYSEHASTNPDFKLCKPTVSSCNYSDFELKIKGCSSFSSMGKRLANHADSIKAEIDQLVEKIDQNAVLLDEVQEQYKTLFQDRKQLLMMSSELLESTISQRISEHKVAELERIAREKSEAEERERQQNIAKENAKRKEIERSERERAAEAAKTAISGLAAKEFDKIATSAQPATKEPNVAQMAPEKQQYTAEQTDQSSEATVIGNYQVVIEINASVDRAKEIAQDVFNAYREAPGVTQVRLPNPTVEIVD